MSDPQAETQKRLAILDEISGFIAQRGLKIASSRVGGSMAFAQNFAIKPTSDIDLDLFLPFSEVEEANPLLDFLQAQRKFFNAEDWTDFDLLCSNGEYKGVAINIWIFNTDTFAEIAKLEKDYIRYFTLHQPSPEKEYNIFGGGKCTLNRHVEPFRDGYRSRRYILNGDDLISENYILNNMFFVFAIHGEEYSREIVEQMWTAFLKKYPATTREQIMNFLIDNVKERFSPEYIQKLDKLLAEKLS